MQVHKIRTIHTTIMPFTTPLDAKFFTNLASKTRKKQKRNSSTCLVGPWGEMVAYYTHLVWLDRETLRFFVSGVYRSGSGLSVWELYSSRFVYYFLSIKMRSKTFLLLVSSLLWGHGAAKRKRFFRAQHASTESLLQPRIVGGYDSEVGEFPYYGTLADDVFDVFRLVMES